MKSIYEEAGGTYTRQGDYELPDLKVPPEKEIEIGIWGQRHRRYLKQYHKIRYYNLLTSGTPVSYTHLSDGRDTLTFSRSVHVSIFSKSSVILV